MKSRTTGQVVAVKTLRNENPYRGRVKEANVFSNYLKPHPRITEMIICFLDQIPGSSQVIVFEYCDAGDLWDLLSKFREHRYKVPESFLWHIGIHMSEALAYIHHGVRGSGRPAHWTGVIHADIKPENILLRWVPGESRNSRYPDIVLADFGVAQIEGAVSPNDNGTPEWWPPEKTKNSKAADVWALGAILHLAALGESPAKPLPTAYTDSHERRAWWHRQSRSRQVSSIYPRYAQILSYLVCERMLKRDPRQRPSSIELDRLFQEKGRRLRDHLFKALPSWAFK